jgi:hypothetical protein
MRTGILALIVAAGLLLVPAGPSVEGWPAAVQAAALDAQQPPGASIDVDINEGEGVWYTSPIWIAIGAIALVVVVLLIVTATRGGGGTTVVRG